MRWQLFLGTEAGLEGKAASSKVKGKKGGNALMEVGQSLILRPVSLGSLGTVIATVGDGDCTTN